METREKVSLSVPAHLLREIDKLREWRSRSQLISELLEEALKARQEARADA